VFPGPPATEVLPRRAGVWTVGAGCSSSVSYSETGAPFWRESSPSEMRLGSGALAPIVPPAGSGAQRLEAARVDRGRSVQQRLHRPLGVREPLSEQAGERPVEGGREFRLVAFHCRERVGRQPV
jgi:hypothetical protein